MIKFGYNPFTKKLDIAGSVVGTIILQGEWNALTNTPDITGTVTPGFAWYVTVAGSTELGGITTWDIGDLAVKTASGWLKIANADISATWGNITGDITTQTDLQNALDAKVDENVAIVAGTKTKITYDTKGLVTQGEEASASDIDNDSSVTGASVKDALETLANSSNPYITVGVYGTEPTFTDNGNGTGDISGFDVVLRDAVLGDLNKYTLTGANNLSFTDGGAEYIAVNYNSGTPLIFVTSNYTLFDNATIVPVYKCWRTGNTVHSLSADAMAVSLPEKIDTMLTSTMPYNRAGRSGLMISESTSPSARTIIVTQSYVFAGTVGILVSGYNSSTDLLTKATVVGTTWTYSSASAVYDNLNINPTTGEEEMTSNSYGVRWFYRSIGDVKEVFYVEGKTNHPNYAKAEEESERSDLPNVIKQHCMLIGRAIIKKSATSGITVSAFEVSFAGASTIDHNDTSNIQGGSSGDYQHLTSAQLAKVNALNIKNTVTVTRSSTRVPKITKIETLGYTYNIALDPNGNRPLTITDGTDTWTPTRVMAGGGVVSVS